MLTKNDLSQIRSVIKEEISLEVAPIKKDVKEISLEVTSLKKDVKEVVFEVTSLKKDVTEIKRDVKKVQKDMAFNTKYLDNRNLDLKDRVKTIERQIGITSPLF